MATLSFSICMSLLHSLWQSALLLLVYIIAEKVLQNKFTPQQRKNLLFVSLVIQSILFAFTFFVYYLQPAIGLQAILQSSIISDLIPGASLNKAIPWIFSGYCAVLVFKVFKAVYEWVLFKKHYKTGLVKPAPSLKVFTTKHQYLFGIKKSVQLWFSNNITTPVTFGFFKPVIVLPVALINQISIQQAEALILHELAHIKANDFLINWFIIVLESVFFFNPFIISLCRKIKIEREKKCDLTVTAFNYSPLLYAEALLKAQTINKLTPQTVSAAVNKPEHLLNRIEFFVNPANQLQFRDKKLAAGLLPFAMLLVTGISIFIQVGLLGSKTNATSINNPKTNLVLLKNENTLPVMVNNVLNQFTEENLTKLAAAVEKQQPEIEKKIKLLQPLIKNIESKAQKLSGDIGNNLITPVSLQENEAVSQIVIKEEQSGSENAILRVYNVIYKDGKWQLQPQWKLAAKEVVVNPGSSSMDTSTPQLQDSLKEVH